MIRFGAVICVLSLVHSVNAVAQSAPPTAEEIVQRYIAARGGLEKIRAVRTLVLRGPERPDGKPPRRMVRARPFYFTIGGEGNDGAPWEAYDRYGLVARVTNAPGDALRHTAYFDDPLIMSLEPGWRLELTGSETIDGHDAYRLRATYPDGWVNDLFVDKESWLLIARRATAPVHAFGDAVTSTTLIGDYREAGGALFATSFRGWDPITKRAESGGQWSSIEANVAIPATAFAPPEPPDTPVAHLVNAIFASRFVTPDALGWYHDFLRNPATASVDVEGAVESVAYHCLKSGGVATALALLEENLRAHPQSAAAHFGIGRAYRAANREEDAEREFHEALRLDPQFGAAKDALASRVLKE